MLKEIEQQSKIVKYWLPSHVWQSKSHVLHLTQIHSFIHCWNTMYYKVDQFPVWLCSHWNRSPVDLKFEILTALCWNLSASSVVLMDPKPQHTCCNMHISFSVQMLLEPYNYICQIPGKKVRTKLAAVSNAFLWKLYAHSKHVYLLCISTVSIL